MQAIVSAFERIGSLKRETAETVARALVLTTLSAAAGSAICFRASLNPLVGGEIGLYTSVITLLVHEILKRLNFSGSDKRLLSLVFAAAMPIHLSAEAYYIGFAITPHLMVALAVANLASTLLTLELFPR